MARSKRAESRCRYLVRKVATQKGWDVRHPQKGGQFLEEQEIEDYFKDSGLGKTKPDFLVCKNYQPIVVVEAKNEKNKIDNAINEAIEYADAINEHGKYKVNIAVGVAGEEDNGYLFVTKYFNGKDWIDLSARGFVLTSFPSVAEVDNAIFTNNGTTEVSIPNVSDYIVTAIELSSILRSAKIEPSLRPKVLGAVITAMYQGEIDLTAGNELNSINQLVADAINSTDHFEETKKQQLIETLKMSEADYSRLAPKMGKIIYILKMLNIKSILQTDTDFLGLLYEAFIRYGYDNNSLGIVFTPRHITKYCAELIDVTAKDKVITNGYDFDPKQDVEATDEEDGKIEVEVIDNKVNKDELGTYQVTYQATDSYNQTVVKTINVTVVANQLPTINVSDKTIYLNEDFDEKEGIEVLDPEDGNITDKLKIKETTVDITKVGEYKVVYEVTDNYGDTVTKEIKVTVTEKKLKETSGNFYFDYLKEVDDAFTSLSDSSNILNF